MFVDIDRLKVWTNTNGVSFCPWPCSLAKRELNFSGADLPLWSLKLGWQGGHSAAAAVTPRQKNVLQVLQESALLLRSVPPSPRA
jgi:hypothetical protein